MLVIPFLKDICPLVTSSHTVLHTGKGISFSLSSISLGRAPPGALTSLPCHAWLLPGAAAWLPLPSFSLVLESCVLSLSEFSHSFWWNISFISFLRKGVEVNFVRRRMSKKYLY